MKAHALIGINGHSSLVPLRGPFRFYPPEAMRKDSDELLDLIDEYPPPPRGFVCLNLEPWGSFPESAYIERIAAVRGVLPGARIGFTGFPNHELTDWTGLINAIDVCLPTCYPGRGKSGSADAARKIVERCHGIPPFLPIVPVLCCFDKDQASGLWAAADDSETDAIVTACVEASDRVKQVVFWHPGGQAKKGLVTGYADDSAAAYTAAEVNRLRGG